MAVIHIFPNGLKLLWPPYTKEEQADLERRRELAEKPPIRIMAPSLRGKTAAAAEKEDREADGQSPEEGEGVLQDYAEAMKWYRKAAEQGNADAQYSLGWMYDNELGVPQNYEEAFKWYRVAAEQGHADAQSRAFEFALVRPQFEFHLFSNTPSLSINGIQAS